MRPYYVDFERYRFRGACSPCRELAELLQEAAAQLCQWPRRLRERAETWVKQVRDTGKPMDLEPMNAADRRIIHKLAAEYSLSSESVGEGRDRHIVLKPSTEA